MLTSWTLRDPRTGHTIAQREREKTQTLAPAWTRIGYAFIPCVANVFGGLGTRTTDYVSSLADHVESRMGVSRASFRAYWNRTLAFTAAVSSCRELWSANEGLRRDRPERAIENRSARMGFLAYAAMMVDYCGIRS